MATKKRTLKKKSKVDERKLEQWKEKGQSLAKADSRNQWDVAKWMCKGEDNFQNRKPYRLAAAITGMTVGTLRQFAHTARNVGPLTRVNELSFGHHRLVAAYTPEKQEEYLRHALKNKETVASFADFLKDQRKGTTRRGDERSDADKSVSMVIEACETFLRNHNLGKLLNALPTKDARTELLARLEKAATELRNKAKELATVWHEYDEADAAFLRASSQEHAIAAGAGK